MSKHITCLMGALLALVVLNSPRPVATATPSHTVYLPIMHNPEYLRILAAGPEGLPRTPGYLPSFRGIVQNVTNDPIYDVMLEVRFYDMAGTQVFRSTGSLVLPVTFPGETNIFQVPGPQVSERTFPYTYDVRVTHLSLSSAVDYRSLTVVSQANASCYPTQVVAGEIRNNHSASVSAIKVRVGNTTAEVGSTVLAPGATTSYQATPWGYTAGFCMPDVVTVQAQGVVTP